MLRAELLRDWIEDYATDMAAGTAFPPIVVFHDGKRYWLADGFHRLYATEVAGLETIKADVRDGTRRDALRHASSANAGHGHRRTNEDKRRAVDIMLDDAEWARLTDENIAAVCSVSFQMVANWRRARFPKEPVATTEEPNDFVVLPA